MANGPTTLIPDQDNQPRSSDVDGQTFVLGEGDQTVVADAPVLEIDDDDVRFVNEGTAATTGDTATVRVSGEDAEIFNATSGSITAEGTGVEVTSEGSAEILNRGAISGDVNGVNFANGGESSGSLRNFGTVSSDSRAVNIGGNDTRVSNFGTIEGTGDQRNGTIYSDGTADNFDIVNQSSGIVDAGEGNDGAGVALQTGDIENDVVEARFVNRGDVAGRGQAAADGGTAGDGVRVFAGADTPTYQGDIVNSGTITSESEQGAVSAVRVADGVNFDGSVINSRNGLIDGANNGLYFGTGEHDAQVRNFGTIQSGSRAINIDGSGVDLINAGEVLGTGDQRNGTIYADSTADAYRILNARDGLVDAGEGNNGSGISLQTGDVDGDAVSAVVINAGEVRGRGDAESGNTIGDGIRVFSSVDDATLSGRIVNTGTIEASAESDAAVAIRLEDGVTLDGIIANQGRLSANETAIDASDAGGSVTVTNSGEIDGAVVLSDGDDRFFGARSSFETEVDGGKGDDILLTGAGHDELTGGLGNDLVNGGDGIDTARFDDVDVSVSANLGSRSASRETGFSIKVIDQPLVSLTTDQSPEDLLAEALANNLYYNIHTNDFPGGEIRGQLLVESEVTDGGVRTVTLRASLDAAQEPGPTSDSEATGEGVVTIVEANGVITYSSSLSVSGLSVADLLPVAGVSPIHLHNAPAGTNGPVITDIVQDAGGDVDGNAKLDAVDTGDGNVFVENAEFDRLLNIENLVGSNDGDELVGDDGANTLEGFGGNDTLLGGDGDDFIAGGGGVDSLDGGEGNDTNSFQDIGAEVVADLVSGSASYQTGSGVTVFENFSNFENLDGSDNDDQLFGDGGANTLTGGDGDDLLAGRGGDDVLEGGLGDDILRGGGGNDVTDGGEGIDTADFSDIGVSVSANLNSGTTNYVVNGTAVQDQLISIENLTGSANDDTLVGDSNGNLLAGGAGSDVLIGGAGDDVLRGDAVGDGEAITVTVTNTLGEGGTFLTPLWFGFHDGSTFDLFDVGEAASLGLERLAEDGSVEGIAAEFNAQTGENGEDATIIGANGVPGPIDPGETASFTLNVNFDDVGQGFFTWATMVIPSNDAFLSAPDDPFADPIFDSDGNFLGPLVIERFGSDVLDAGTEVNDEEGAAFLNQTARDQGVAENGVVGDHPGFNGSQGNPDGAPVNVLGGTTPGGVIDPIEGDFTRNGGEEQLLRIVVDRIAGANDTLVGGAGDDTLDGGGGNDTLEGGTGVDTFIFGVYAGIDEIVDFENGVDVLDLSADGLGFESVEDVLGAASQDGANTVIDLGSDSQVTLLDIDVDQLDFANILV